MVTTSTVQRDWGELSPEEQEDYVKGLANEKRTKIISLCRELNINTLLLDKHQLHTLIGAEQTHVNQTLRKEDWITPIQSAGNKGKLLYELDEVISYVVRIYLVSQGVPPQLAKGVI